MTTDSYFLFLIISSVESGCQKTAINESDTSSQNPKTVLLKVTLKERKAENCRIRDANIREQLFWVFVA